MNICCFIIVLNMISSFIYELCERFLAPQTTVFGCFWHPKIQKNQQKPQKNLKRQYCLLIFYILFICLLGVVLYFVLFCYVLLCFCNVLLRFSMFFLDLLCFSSALLCAAMFCYVFVMFCKVSCFVLLCFAIFSY